MSLKVQFRHVQASIPRTYKKKRKRSVRKVSQIKKQTHTLARTFQCPLKSSFVMSKPAFREPTKKKRKKSIRKVSQIKKQTHTLARTYQCPLKSSFVMSKPAFREPTKKKE